MIDVRTQPSAKLPHTPYVRGGHIDYRDICLRLLISNHTHFLFIVNNSLIRL